MKIFKIISGYFRNKKNKIIRMIIFELVPPPGDRGNEVYFVQSVFQKDPVFFKITCLKYDYTVY